MLMAATGIMTAFFAHSSYRAEQREIVLFYNYIMLQHEKGKLKQLNKVSLVFIFLQ
jgi:hypothetical protein